MSWLNKVKDAAMQNMGKITEVDTGNLIQKLKINSNEVLSEVSRNSKEIIDSTKKSFEDIDTLQMINNTKEKVTNLTEQSKIFFVESFEKSQSIIDNIDWDKVTDSGYQKENLIQYWQSGTNKLNEMARSTLEVDKNTMDMVSDLKEKLPVPAQTIDEIFSQCRKVALQRATAAFFLGGITDAIDQNSSKKYENLSESYKEYGDRIGEAMKIFLKCKINVLKQERNLVHLKMVITKNRY